MAVMGIFTNNNIILLPETLCFFANLMFKCVVDIANVYKLSWLLVLTYAIYI